MKFHLIAASVLLAGSTVALAQDAPDNRVTQASTSSSTQSEVEGTEESENGDEVVCRRERITGSLTRVRRTCLTRDEWAQIEANTRDDMIRSGRNASGSQCIPDNPVSGRC
ncbi:MAG: hypothetical protein WA957_17520 [Alteraurantiacibacter sp.]